MASTFAFDPSALLAVAVATVAIYVYLVVLLRVTGNRALASLRAFDFVVVVAIGSLIATTVASTSVPLLNGVVAITLLILLQWAVAAMARVNPRFNTAVTSPPTLLFYDGAYVDEGLRTARVTPHEVQTAMRKSGFSTEERVWAVVLEPNGNLSVVGRDHAAPSTERNTLRGMPMKAREPAVDEREGD